MATDLDQQNRMRLGGTQALPAPSPALGRIRWDDADATHHEDRLVQIVHEKSPGEAVVWVVRLQDIMAIEAKQSFKAEPAEVTWHYGDAVTTALKAKAGVTGVAYVNRDAKTLLRLEHGVSVEESVVVAAGEPLLGGNEIFETKDCC